MCPTAAEKAQNGTANHLERAGSTMGMEDSNLLRLLDRPRPVNVERNKSFDERSLNEMSITLSPPRVSNIFDVLDTTCSPGRWTGTNTPRSSDCFEPHPIVGEAWDALRRSIVYFRGQAVGTIAALDQSTEELNYDQVNIFFGNCC